MTRPGTFERREPGGTGGMRITCRTIGTRTALWQLRSDVDQQAAVATFPFIYTPLPNTSCWTSTPSISWTITVAAEAAPVLWHV